MAEEEQQHIDPKVFAKLNAIEQRFNKAEEELLKKQVELYNPIYQERDPLLLQIPKFWVTVIGETQELEELFNLEDSKLLDHLLSVKVARKTADPKNFSILMTFEENEFLDDSSLILTKDFSRAKEGSAGGDEYTSKAVQISWKKDVTAENAGGRPSFFKFFEWTGNGQDEFEQGEEVALILADEVYSDALKIWTEAQDLDDDEDSNLGSVDIQSGEDDDEAEDEEDDEQEQEGPQKKKAKTG